MTIVLYSITHVTIVLVTRFEDLEDMIVCHNGLVGQLSPCAWRYYFNWINMMLHLLFLRLSRSPCLITVASVLLFPHCEFQHSSPSFSETLQTYYNLYHTRLLYCLLGIVRRKHLLSISVEFCHHIKDCSSLTRRSTCTETTSRHADWVEKP